MGSIHHKPETRFTVAQACLWGLFLPVRTVKRSYHLPLIKAWAVHLFGLVMCLLALFVANVVANYDYFFGSPHSLGLVMHAPFANLMREFSHPFAWALTIMIWLFIEVDWLIAAALFMGFSARDEKIRFSYVRALKRLLLLTPHAAVLVLIASILVVLSEEFQDGLGWEWYQQIEACRFLLLSCLGLWQLWIILRALTHDPPAEMSRWPARCMKCGYQLLGLRPDQSCPECGNLVGPSLDPTTRPGLDKPAGPIWWLKRSTLSGIQPTKLGQNLHTLCPDLGHRRCLSYTIIGQMIGSFLGVAVIYIVLVCVESWHREGFHFDFEEMMYGTMLAGSIIGGMLVAATIATAGFGASLIGCFEGWRNGRNLMPAAIRAACYQSGFMVFWAFVCHVNLTLFIILIELGVLWDFSQQYNISMDLILFLWLGGILLLGLLIYLIQIARATHAARHANW